MGASVCCNRYDTRHILRSAKGAIASCGISHSTAEAVLGVYTRLDKARTGEVPPDRLMEFFGYHEADDMTFRLMELLDQDGSKGTCFADFLVFSWRYLTFVNTSSIFLSFELSDIRARGRLHYEDIMSYIDMSYGSTSHRATRHLIKAVNAEDNWSVHMHLDSKGRETVSKPNFCYYVMRHVEAQKAARSVQTRLRKKFPSQVLSMLTKEREQFLHRLGRVHIAQEELAKAERRIKKITLERPLPLTSESSEADIISAALWEWRPRVVGSRLSGVEAEMESLKRSKSAPKRAWAEEMDALRKQTKKSMRNVKDVVVEELDEELPSKLTALKSFPTSTFRQQTLRHQKRRKAEANDSVLKELGTKARDPNVNYAVNHAPHMLYSMSKGWSSSRAHIVDSKRRGRRAYTAWTAAKYISETGGSGVVEKPGLARPG